MSNRMHRTQILLDPEQHQQLSQLAQNENRSLSDVIREMLDAQLATRQRETASLLQRRLAALERIASHRQQVLDERNGQPLMIQVQQMIDQLREERDEQYVTNFN